MVQQVQRFLHFFHSAVEQRPLLFQDFFSGFNGIVTLLDQSDVLDQRLNWKPGAPHALDEFNPFQIDFAVISDAISISIDWLD